jgi:DNA-binding transcriptional ArsR family regulator
MEYSLFEAQADFCKSMGNASRLQLLHTLRGGPSTVGELAQAVGMSQAAVSRQLAALRSVGVVISQRRAREVVYQLADPKIGEVCDMVRQVLVERILKDKKMIAPASREG